MRALGPVLAIVVVLYPALVYFGGRWLEPRFLGLLVLGLYALRLAFALKAPGRRALALCALAAGAGLLWYANSQTLLHLLPAAINLAFAGYFAWTLHRPPTLPERVASLSYPEGLPDVVVSYTRAVTRVWIGFFLANGGVAAATALFASPAVWALYNGALAYGLIGLVFAAEYAYRELVFHKKHAL